MKYSLRELSDLLVKTGITQEVSTIEMLEQELQNVYSKYKSDLYPYDLRTGSYSTFGPSIVFKPKSAKFVKLIEDYATKKGDDLVRILEPEEYEDGTVDINLGNEHIFDYIDYISEQAILFKESFEMEITYEFVFKYQMKISDGKLVKNKMIINFEKCDFNDCMSGLSDLNTIIFKPYTNYASYNPEIIVSDDFEETFAKSFNDRKEKLKL